MVAVVQLLNRVWLFATPRSAALPARLLCPCSNSCPLSQWRYLTISSSATRFSFAFSLSQHQGLFQWVSSLHQVAKVLELQLQHQSFQWIFRVDFPEYWLVWGETSRCHHFSQTFLFETFFLNHIFEISTFSISIYSGRLSVNDTIVRILFVFFFVLDTNCWLLSCCGTGLVIFYVLGKFNWNVFKKYHFLNFKSTYFTNIPM